jgi:hypothetical protein
MFQNINIRDNHVEVGLVLPWKNHIYIEYTVSCQWPPSSSDNVGPSSSPMSVPSASGPWVYTGCDVVHYSISIEGEFPLSLIYTLTIML